MALQAPTRHIHVVNDATSSRTTENWTAGLNRMREAGAIITSTEMLIFELLKKARTEEFRAVLKLVKKQVVGKTPAIPHLVRLLCDQ